MKDYKEFLDNALIVLSDIEEELEKVKEDLLEEYKRLLNKEKWVYNLLDVIGNYFIAIVDNKKHEVIRAIRRGDK